MGFSILPGIEWIICGGLVALILLVQWWKRRLLLDPCILYLLARAPDQRLSVFDCNSRYSSIKHRRIYGALVRLKKSGYVEVYKSPSHRDLLWWYHVLYTITDEGREYLKVQTDLLFSKAV